MWNSLAALDCDVVRNPRWAVPLAVAGFLTPARMAEAARALAGLKGYRPSPIVALPGLARVCGLAALSLKNEDARLPIHSFKALGPPLALARALARRLAKQGQHADEAAILGGDFAAQLADITVTAASSGNHGRALAWAARQAGCRCVIFMAAHTGAEREHNIACYGAEVRRIPGTYDDALGAAVTAGTRRGWILVSEIGSDKEPEIPEDTILGYSMVGTEMAEQCASRPPTHLFLSAGSGAMAGGILAALASRLGEACPRIVLVEPVEAAGLLRSARTGQYVAATGTLRTVMDGLAVRWPSPHAWPVLRDNAFAFMAIPDDAALLALRALARGSFGDPGLEIGETGIAALAGALVAAAQPPLRDTLALTPDSRVMALACEGVTDRAAFDRLLREAEARFAGRPKAAAAASPADGAPMAQPSGPLPPPFAPAEFAGRIERARTLMTEAGLDGLLVTSEANFRYLTGFVSQFWLSPTRPWYFVLPREGEPVAIVPEVGVENMRATSWVERLETWPSPRPEDDGVTLLAGVLARLPRRFGRIGAELGPESRLGMPVGDFLVLRDRISPLTLADGSRLVNRLRMVKSPAEVARIRFACRAVADGFAALPGFFAPGDTEASLCRKLHIDLIRRGVEKVPYLIGCSGPGGYRTAIMSPSERRLAQGDILVIDTGTTCDGYFCDFDRNWAFGSATDAARRAYDLAWRATEAGIRAARPGARASDLWRAQAEVLEPAGGGNVGSRMGHAIGLALTEPPSNKPDDDTLLEPGMVMTIEPGLRYGDGLLMLHEENLVITEDGCELLTRRAPRELPILPL